MAYLNFKNNGQGYRIPLPESLQDASDKVKLAYADHFILSAIDQPEEMEDGRLFYRTTDEAMGKFPLKGGGEAEVLLPRTATTSDAVQTEMVRAIAKLEDPFQQEEARKEEEFDASIKDMSPIEAFVKSGIGESQQLWTGLKQQGNRFLGDSERFAELQKESDKRQEGLDAISGENPVSSFLGSVAPYFTPLGLGPIMRGVGLAGKIPSAMSNIASKIPKGTWPRKVVGGGSELFNSPIALAGMVGAAEGTIHPQQDAISGLIFGAAGNTIGRHLAKWTPFEKVSGGAPTADQKEVIGFLDKYEGVVQPYMRTGDVSDLSKHYKDRLDPREVNRFATETLPKNEQAIQRSLLDIIAKGDNSPPEKLVSNAKKAITDDRLNKGLIQQLKYSMKPHTAKADVNLDEKRNIFLNSFGKSDIVKAQKQLDEAKIHKVNMDKKKNAADILYSSFHAGGKNLEEVSKKINDIDLDVPLKDGKNIELLEMLRSQYSPIQKTVDHMIQMKKDFNPAGELSRSRVLGGVNDYVRSLDKHGFSGDKLPEGLLGDIGAGLGYSTHDNPVTFGTNKYNFAVDLFKSLQGNPE